MGDGTGELGVGDRFVEGPAPELISSAFALEASYGHLLHHGMSLADLAHTVVLIEQKIMPASLGAQLLRALLELHNTPPAALSFDPALGDPYNNREQALKRRAPEAADWLQAGRARRESSTVGYTLGVRSGLLDVGNALLELLRALLSRAAANAHTLMPDYTYLQTAQPTTLGHYFLTFVAALLRDTTRLRAAFEHADRSPAGIGSTNGSRLPLDRLRLASLLGFPALVLHARDAMWQPDMPIEVVAALNMALLNADRLAEDLQIWATAEFGYVELADRHSRISVIMPQKKNPYSLAFVRGVARDLIGKLVSVAATQATPSAQIDNRIFCYASVPLALEQSSRALGLLAGVVAGLRINTATLRQRARQEHSGATDLAEALMLTYGLSARTAHRIVGQAVRRAFEGNQNIDAHLLDVCARDVIKRPLHLSDRFIAEYMDPEQIVATRTAAGGAAPPAVYAMLDEFSAATAAFASWLDTQRQRIGQAEQALLRHAASLCEVP
jgi:argininosuccinate lyase